MLKSLILAAVLALAGCAATSTAAPPGGSTPIASAGLITSADAQRMVFATKSAYATALTAAVAYKRLPVCSGTVSAPCSNSEVVTQIQKADNVTAAALDAAEAAVRTTAITGDARNAAITTATAALSALQSLVASIGSTK